MKTIKIGKNYKATTRYYIGSNGSIEQQTTVYEPKTGTHVQPVFQTKHCKVQVTKGGLIVRFKFSRRQKKLCDITKLMTQEQAVVKAFLNSKVGYYAIETAETELYDRDPDFQRALLKGRKEFDAMGGSPESA